jgi:hypothetical protein
MGRLILNVLLSFAQFEREVTSERIRDKVAASKRKGLWVGGMAPLGYDTKDRKITVNETEAEAECVRTIFRTYLKLGSLNLLMQSLRTKRIVTKIRVLKTGETVGGIPFTRGPLAHLLRNRFYVGEVAFKGEILAGEQPAIVDRDLFEAVQAKLSEQVTSHEQSRTRSEALLLGRIYDDRGHRMTPSHVRKRDIKYRYYISSALLQGRSKQAGTVSRVPAKEVEDLVAKAVRNHFKETAEIADAVLIHKHVARTEIQPNQIFIELENAKTANSKRKQNNHHVIEVPWRKTSPTRRREVLVPDTGRPQDARPIRSENRALLIASIAQGRRWLNEIITNPTVKAENIAVREGCSARQVNMTISLAFLAPDLVKAAIEGRLPHGHGVTRMRDLPAEWPRQRLMLGL